MGIPGLSKNLKPYAVAGVVGCKTPECQIHRSQQGSPSSNIIIDGPSFAYAIYHRLLVHKLKWLTAVEAMPSYNEIGKGALAFLDELESYGLNVESIYFDGYLPEHKREVRIDRLRKSLLQLSKYYAESQIIEFCKRKSSGESLSPAVVLQSAPPNKAAFRGVPPATFLVPAVLDVLSSTKYARITSMVPGEAEAYCAAAARTNGGIVLSNDSDLYLHDLGSGTFVNLGSVQMHPGNDGQQGINSEGCKVIKLDLNCPRDIAERLGLQNLGELAYQFVVRYPQTLPEATRNAKKYREQDQAGLKTLLKVSGTEPSLSEDGPFPPLAKTHGTTRIQFLDPRTSELICQLASKDWDTAKVYLLSLIEDPSRSSGWLVSNDQRSFAYSICAQFLSSKTDCTKFSIQECTRRGREFIMQEVSLLNESEIFTYASNLRTQLHNLAQSFPDIPSNLVWRIYAVFEVYRWHLNSDKVPPSSKLINTALKGNSNPYATWEDIHLSAQIQALLYSLRVIRQVLGYFSSVTIMPLPEPLERLAAILKNLPPLAQLMPSPFELTRQTANLDSESILYQLAEALQNEAGPTDVSIVDGIEEGTAACTKNTAHKKRKKSKKKKITATKSGSKQSNIYEALA